MSEVESHPEGKDQLTVTTGQHQAIATNRPASIQTGKSRPCKPDTRWSIPASRPRRNANGDGNEGDSG